MAAQDPSLSDLGWTPFFSAQLGAQDAALWPVRVMAVHRGQIAVAGAQGALLVSPHIASAGSEEDHATVGDWLLIDPDTMRIARILQRVSLFKRRTPGNVRKQQLIAANVDTVFLVASCNQDFNVARLERYLVLAREAGVHPVIVLTKIDLADDPESFAIAARGLQPDLLVETINAKEPASVARLATWCGEGKTVALLGSSGVGKSTLIKTLTCSEHIATQPVREADGKGRHTTTVRELHRLAQGGWLMDTPGMRELHLSESAEGLAEVFDDIVSLAQQCRFSNCTHGGEPGCVVQPALASGEIDALRYARWRKLSEADAPPAPGAPRNKPPRSGRGPR